MRAAALFAGFAIGVAVWVAVCAVIASAWFTP